MNIEKIRKNVEEKKGEVMHFCFRGSRGQVDDYQGIIMDTFKGIFIVQSIDDNRVKSYSYSDILIENLTFEEEQ